MPITPISPLSLHNTTTQNTLTPTSPLTNSHFKTHQPLTLHQPTPKTHQHPTTRYKYNLINQSQIHRRPRLRSLQPLSAPLFSPLARRLLELSYFAPQSTRQPPPSPRSPPLPGLINQNNNPHLLIDRRLSRPPRSNLRRL